MQTKRFSRWLPRDNRARLRFNIMKRCLMKRTVYHDAWKSHGSSNVEFLDAATAARVPRVFAYVLAVLDSRGKYKLIYIAAPYVRLLRKLMNTFSVCTLASSRACDSVRVTSLRPSSLPSVTLLHESLFALARKMAGPPIHLSKHGDNIFSRNVETAKPRLTLLLSARTRASKSLA